MRYCFVSKVIMHIILIILIVGTFYVSNEAVSSSPFTSSSGIIDVQKAVDYLNSIPNRTWTAGSNGLGPFVYPSDMMFRGGIKTPDFKITAEFDNKDSNKITGEQPQLLGNAFKDEFLPYQLPDNYDARTMYPHCTTISSIRDQSNCGSCWAAATASVLSDHLCIHSKGLINVNISMNYLVACAPQNFERGCDGYVVQKAWYHIYIHGAITGGDFETFDGCQPYEIAPCGEHDMFPCQQPRTPKCRGTTCTNEYYESKKENKIYKIRDMYMMLCNETHPCSERSIRHTIYVYGPVIASMVLYEPFNFYKKGVFHINTKNFKSTGWHAVRIIGWGVENGIPYWLVANSWGKHWGDNGTFKIIRGQNHCSIETFIEFADPLIPSDVREQMK